jgi:hypothetical protein
MNRRRRADRKLHLELLRARAAADRLQLSLAMRDISEQLDPLRRAADSIGVVTRTLGGRGRLLGWLVAGIATLMRGRRIGRTALGALAAGAVALLVRRAGRREADPG